MKKQLKSVKKSVRYNKKETKKASNIKVVSDKQVDKIDSIENIQHKAIIDFLLESGLRVSELVNLSYSDLFEDIKRKSIKENLILIGKGNKERIIPITTKLRIAILNLHYYNTEILQVKINKNSPILISQKLVRMSRQQIYNITKQEINTNPHCLRHSCFTELRKAGVSGEIIQKLAGHSNYDTTLKYYINISVDDIRNAMENNSKQERKLFQVI